MLLVLCDSCVFILNVADSCLFVLKVADAQRQLYFCVECDFVPKGVHENRTVRVENNIAGRLKLGVF